MKKTILLLTAILSTSAFAETKIKLSFPYAEYKEIEFVNPTLTTKFENYIVKMEKSDVDFSQKYQKTVEEYEKKYTNAQKRAAYKKEKDRKKFVDDIVIKEEKIFNELMLSYLKDQVGIFNQFVKEVQNNKYLTKEENIVFLKSIKDVHQSYVDAHATFKYRVSTYNDYCFDDVYSGFLPDWCYVMYDESTNDVNEFKYMVNTKMNGFITAYKVNSTKRSFRKELEIKIQEIKRYQEFKWE